MESKLEQVIDLKLPFALYRLPMGDTVQFLAQNTTELYPWDGKRNGFVFHPYSTVEQLAIVLVPSIERELFPNELQNHGIKLNTNNKNYFTSKEGFKNTVERALEQIYQGEAQKVVLSRVIEVPKPTKKGVFDLFQRLLNQKEALVYLFHHPKLGTWLGATPEQFISKKDGNYSTVSLAGTMGVLEKREWTEKERTEQAIVTEFILGKLNQLNASSINVSKVKDQIAGPIKHLYTSIEFDSDESILGIANQLHPTPAVCGFPRKEARRIIKELEKHTRSYYTGFCGPIDHQGNAHLFVNLRCAQVFQSKYHLYVGCGILAGSDPEQEWIETENKAKTLLAEIENL